MGDPLKNKASELCQELFGISFNFEYVFYENEVNLTQKGDFLYKAKLSGILYYDLQGPNSGKYTIKNGIKVDSNGRHFEPKYSFNCLGSNYDIEHLQLTRNVDQIIEEGEVSYNFLVNEVQIQIVIKKWNIKGTILFRIIYIDNSPPMNFQPNFVPNIAQRNFGMMPNPVFSGYSMPHFL